MLALLNHFLIVLLVLTILLVKYNDPIVQAIWWIYLALGGIALGVWAFKKFFGGSE
jgi:hypothetical protein